MFSFCTVSSRQCFAEDSVALHAVDSADVGAAAPNFMLVNAIDGDVISLIDYRGKVVLLDFFATICGSCCRGIDEDLVPLHSKYADDPRIVFLSIDVCEPEITVEELQTFANNHLIDWAILMGSTSSLAWDANWGGDYNLTVVPTVFIIDSMGVIRQRHPYPVPNAMTLGSEIDSLISINTDLNGDGTVNILDIVVVAKSFGSNLGGPNWIPAADLNHDGAVNIVDLSMVAKDFGKKFGL
jgi:peroxiredoxin